jgi:DNA polymerase III delta' subunit
MEQIVGQTHAIGLLEASLAGQRLHHAYIFHGPAGVGKFTTASAFAKVLLCHQTQQDLAGRVLACDGCESCRLVEAGTHPDFHVVTKELARYHDDSEIRKRKLMNIPVEVLRDTLIGPVNLAARMGSRKVFIVDEAELVNEIGQNALLKILEEPPPGTHLFLVTANEDKLLPTIRSRCQRIAFTPVADDLVEAWVADYAQLPGDQVAWLVGFAGGSMGQAKLAIDFDVVVWGEKVEPALEQMAKGRYPTQLGATLTELVNGFAEKWVSANKNASKEAANQQAAGLMWRLIGRWARQRIYAATAALEPSDPVAGEAVLEPVLGVIDALRGAEYEMASHVNMGLVMDHLVSRIYRSLQGVRVVVGL